MGIENNILVLRLEELGVAIPGNQRERELY